MSYILCPHEDNIEYGERVYTNSEVTVNLIRCTTCGDTGAQVETNDENAIFVGEAWHQANQGARR